MPSVYNSDFFVNFCKFTLDKRSLHISYKIIKGKGKKNLRKNQVEKWKRKKILNSNNSFIGQTIQKATQIGSAIQNTINGIGLYNSSGSYAYLNTSSYEYYL